MPSGMALQAAALNRYRKQVRRFLWAYPYLKCSVAHQTSQLISSSVEASSLINWKLNLTPPLSLITAFSGPQSTSSITTPGTS